MKEIIEEHFVNNYKTLVKRFRNRAGSIPNAEDIVSEAYSRALRYADSYDTNKKEVGVWFDNIVNNCLRTFKRDERNYGMCMEFDEQKADGVKLDAIAKVCRKDIHAMIENGTPSQVEILRLYYRHNYKPKEIHEVLDIPIGTISTTITRFMSKVKEKYEDSSR